MSLLIPGALVLGATLPIVVIFYLLKVRRHDEVVSSTFLWEDLVRDLAAHEPLQKLRWNLLLAIQLLVLALLTIGLARPFLEQIGQPPVHAVLVLDGSASMQATDVTPSRFASAVSAAKRTLAELPENSVATVVLAAAHPQVLAAATGDRRQVSKTLDDARPTGGSGDMREALLLARSLGGDPSARRIHVFSDGAFTLPADLPDDLGWVNFVRTAGTGAEAANLAITAIAARPDPRDNRRRQLFTRVENFSDSFANATLALTVDDQPITDQAIEVAPNSTAEQVFEDLPPGARAASVTLRPDAGVSATRVFTLDKQGSSVLTQRKTAQVLLVSPGNQYLEKVLLLLPNLELYRIPARRYLAVEADRFDIVVFDDYLPPLLPRGNLLVVNPPDRGPIRTNGELRRPRIGTWDREDPLLSYVRVADLQINRSKRLDLAKWAKSLVTTTDGVPLLAAGQDGDRRVAIIPFDLRQSNLPQTDAFPILMANFVNYLAPSGIVQSSEIQTGGTETLVPLPQVEKVRITDPSGKIVEVPARSGPITYATTDTPGLYRVQQIVQGGGQTVDEDLFATNLTDPVESDLRPRLPDDALRSAASTVTDALVPLQKELWMWLAAIAIPLLMFEWFWFHRRV